MSDFQKTVNLRKKMGEEEPKPQYSAVRNAPSVSQAKAQEIDKVFNSGEDAKGKKELTKITQPKSSNVNESLVKTIVFILALIIIGAVVYFMFFKGDKKAEIKQEAAQQESWYAVKLLNGEIYYGKIKDVSADPVAIESVYYNYDQLNETETPAEKTESTSLRLVKRGKETHGPTGAMNIVRAQVVYMEQLKEDSKVLQAILQYEK